MTLEAWLWLAVVATAAIYIWLGRSVISQPRWNRPPVFWSQPMLLLACALPLTSFIAIIVVGFVHTGHGWRYLAACAGLYAFFAVKPRLLE